MVANFKFDSGIKSVLIDGYRSLTMTSNGVFSIGKNTNWNSFNDETGVVTLSNLTIGTLGGLLKATGGVVSQASSGSDYEPPVTKGDLTSNNTSVITVSSGTGAVIGSGASITINKSSSSADGYLGKDDWTTFNSKQGALTFYDLSETASGILTITGGTDSVLTNDVTIQVKKASASQDGYIGKDDWATFNAKQSALTFYDLSETASGILTITGGLDSVLTNDVTIQVKKASAAQDGYLGKDDWSTFNAKEPAVTKGDLTSNTTSAISVSGGTGAVIGSGASITINKASSSADGYLGKDDWATFNGKLTSPMTANGDIIVQISGSPDNLAIGSDTQVLTVVSGLPSWQAPAVGSQILQGNTKSYVKDTGSDGYFAVVTEGVEALRVDLNGNVGIGTSSPDERLDLQDGSGNGALILGEHENGTPVAGTIEWTGTQFRWYDGSNWKNVGIELTDPLIYKGVIDCSLNPNYPAADAGHTYRISVAGKIGGASGAVVEVGDMVICNTDNAGGDQAAVGGYWDILQVNLNGAVIGPDSATNNAIARFDTTSGKLIQDGYATVDDFGSINIPSGQNYKINNVNLSATDVGAEPTLTKGNLTSNTTSAISVSGGTGAVIGSGASITINKASSSADGYLGKDDWATFNAKQGALTFYDLSETASGILTITGGTDSVLTNDVTIQVKKASASQDGYLGKDDWSTFNAKEPALTKGNLTSDNASVITITGGTGSVIGSGTSVAINKASASQDGYLGKDDFGFLKLWNRSSVTLSPYTANNTVKISTTGAVTTHTLEIDHDSSTYAAIGLTGTNNLIAGAGHLTVGSVASPTVGASFYMMDTGYSTWLFGNSASANFGAVINPAISARFTAEGIIYDLTSIHTSTGNQARIVLDRDEGAGFSNRVSIYATAESMLASSRPSYSKFGSVSYGSGNSTTELVSFISATGTASLLNLHSLSNGSGTSEVNIYSQNGDIKFNARSSGDIAFNQSGNTTLSGFTATSIIGALNELKSSVTSRIESGNTAAYVRDTGSDGYFAIENEGVESVRVTPTGDMGIGTSSPTSALDVVGSVEVSSDAWYYIGDPTTDGTWRMGIDTGEFVVQKRVTGSWVTKGNFS